LLQPLKCWACSLIEAEEETIYSHVGVVVATSPEVMVAEAFSMVRKLSLNEYNQKTAPLMDYYTGQHKFYAVDGIGSIAEVTERLSLVLDQL
jgi:adenylate kinase family enzyme